MNIGTNYMLPKISQTKNGYKMIYKNNNRTILNNTKINNGERYSLKLNSV